MNKIEGVIMDWAGTAVDFGCFAPVKVFLDIFKNAGVEATMEEARAPMGMLKIDHIRAMLSMPRISRLWADKYGRAFTEDDVRNLFGEFVPALMATLAEYTDPIPGAIEAIAALREQGIKIGSSTGYTGEMMEVVTAGAREKGYGVDSVVTADDTGSKGRPYPYMIYRNMEKLDLASCRRVVKVGDTVSDIEEGVNAGLWTVGVIVGSSEMGLSLEEYSALSEREREEAIEAVTQTFMRSGADFVITSIGDLPNLIGKINGHLQDGKMPGGR